MKIRFSKPRLRGFTLVELLVAMAITTLIVTVLVSITAIATDTWTRSRTELRASRQAKSMVDAMAKDFESMVTRRNNAFEWLVVKRQLPENTPPLQSTNAAELVFFTAPTDRYDGDLGADGSKGDVCGVGYLLDYKDPIGGVGANFSTFVLNRHVVNPDVTFTELLAKDNLHDAFDPFRADLGKTENFICENVYQFTVVFHVEVPGENNPIQITIGDGANRVSEFRFKGTGIETVGSLPTGITPEQVSAGRMVGVEISLTVLSDSAINRISRVGPPKGKNGETDEEAEAKFLTSNSHNYSKFIRLSSL